jgi:hypothetical protein
MWRSRLLLKIESARLPVRLHPWIITDWPFLSFLHHLIRVAEYYVSDQKLGCCAADAVDCLESNIGFWGIKASLPARDLEAVLELSG